jgi:segregation and condensation protein B
MSKRKRVGPDVGGITGQKKKRPAGRGQAANANDKGADMLGEPKLKTDAFNYESGENEPGVPAPQSVQIAGVFGFPPGVAALPSAERREKLRIVEALLFAAAEPLDERALAEHLPPGEAVLPLIEELQNLYAGRGVNLRRIAGKYAFRTAEDLAYLLEKRSVEEKRLSKAALETLSIIAYHQPVTRAEIEEIRGVQTSKGTLDVLLETGWVRMRGRRRAPGRPVTYGTTDQFLGHFGFDSLRDLPGAAELKGAGLLDSALPADFQMPEPTDIAALLPDEDPLEDGEEQLDLLETLDEDEETGETDEKDRGPPSAT